MHKGVIPSVPPGHGTSYFFSLEVAKVLKVSYISRFLNQKVWKWHWLIFTPFGALVNVLLLFHYKMIKGNKKIFKNLFPLTTT